jgi:glycerol-3-phosphate dehydrogenase
LVRQLPSEIETERFDLILIGAGINGAGIARDAALRGLRTLVVDKGDIAGGTTSASTRLVHGGLRYLQHREFGLVRESLRERERLLKNAPHLVRPMPTLFPIYEGASRGPRIVRTGMVVYDALSYDKSLDRHHMLNREQALEHAPGIAPDGLRAGALFFDAQARFAERLAVENAISARELGAIIATYTRVDRIVTEGAVVRGVELTDLLTGDRLTAQARIVVNVAGPWVDQVLAEAPDTGAQPRRIGGTKGSHIVVAPFSGAPDVTLYFESRADGRPMMIVPWNGLYLIGTTDIRFDGDPSEVRTSGEEIDYLLTEANQLVPSAALTPDDVLYTYCGVRPLPYTPSGTAGAITRRHVIVNHAPKLRGLHSIVGGKLTTYRSLAEETIDRICDVLGIDARSTTADSPLPGTTGLTSPQVLASQYGVTLPVAERLLTVYGARARNVLELGRDSPDLLESFDPDTGAIGAEVVFAVREEMATTLEDILMRRTMAGLGPNMAIGADRSAAQVAVRHLGWDRARAEREVDAYRAHLERFQPRALRAADHVS